MANYRLEDGDVFTVSLYCAMLNQVSVNALQVRATVDPGSTKTIQDLANSIDNAASALYFSLLSPNSEYGGVAVRRTIGAGPVPRTAYAFGLQGPGTQAGNALPPQVAVLLNLASETIGLKAQGRLYLPFPSDFFLNSDGTPSSVNLTPVATAFGDYFSQPFSLFALGVAEVTCSFGHQSPIDGLFHSYDRYWVQDRFATQRRRSEYNVKNWLPGGHGS